VEAEVAVGELPVPRHGLHGHPRPLPRVRPQPEERRPLVVHRPPLEDRLFRRGRLLPEDLPEVVVEGVG
jgi:hypothetical protein